MSKKAREALLIATLLRVIAHRDELERRLALCLAVDGSTTSDDGGQW